MRARPPMLLVATTAVVFTLVAAGEAKVYGAATGKSPTSRSVLVAPLVQAMLPPAQANAALSALPARIQQATDDAAAEGATVSVAVLDRATNHMVSNGNQQIITTASVAKLFIADELLLRESQGDTPLSAEDRTALDDMLRSSDDDAAEKFWNQAGGDAIITQVATRYGLTATTPGDDGRWWNAISTTADLIRYYQMLLDGSGGLPPERAETIVNDLAQSTPTGIDGYPQRFGIPDGLYAEPVAVKQGWMCCIGEDWMHLSTGVVGPDRRYIVVIESLQPSDDATARATITNAVKTMFPNGRI
ncbi:MAG: hypothetical protein JOZ23_16595 [Mycobacterium sp.]|nr:hypothetical protein [Mycobacterium sp.]